MPVYNHGKQEITSLSLLYNHSKNNPSHVYNHGKEEISFAPPEPPALEGLKWVPFGDSLSDSGLGYASKYYYDLLHENDGVTVYGTGGKRAFGVGGTGYKRTYEAGNCFYQRADDIPSDTQIITVLGSINDWHYVSNIGTPGETATDAQLEAGTASVQSYMTAFYNVARSKAPNAKIVVCSLPWYYLSGGYMQDFSNDKNIMLRKAQYDFAKHFNFPFYDFTNDYGFVCDEHLTYGDYDWYGLPLWSGQTYVNDLGSQYVKGIDDNTMARRNAFSHIFIADYSTQTGTHGHWNTNYNRVYFYKRFKEILEYEMGITETVPSFKVTGSLPAISLKCDGEVRVIRT